MSPRKLSVVVTAGPTYEHVDPVRFLGNESSGRMGFEIARAAQAAGHRVTLVAGPVHQETPEGVKRVDVVSARDMLAAVEGTLDHADALFMAAAVADWRPRRKLRGKWRKKDDGSDVAILELTRNPDILATVAKKLRRRAERRCLIVGFALETGSGIARARSKMQRKGTDYIVLNDETALGGDRTSVTVLGREGDELRLENRTKKSVARSLVGLLRDLK